MMRRAPRIASGLSLLETVIAIAVGTSLLLAIMSTIRTFYRSNAFTIDQVITINDARKGIEYLARDIREATYGDDGSFPVLAIAPQSFTFFADIDNDTGIERVRYFVDGSDNTLKRGIVKASGAPLSYNPASETISVIVRNVRNIVLATTTFRYFNESGAEITNFGNITAVAHVRLNLVVNVNPTRAPNDFFLRSSATLRNLKTNL